MKKFFASLAFVVVFAAYVAYQGSSSAATASYQATAPSAVPTNSLATNKSGGIASSGGAAPPQGSQLPQPTPAPVNNGLYRDGTYTGNVTDAYYGLVQVQVTVSGGKISDVAFLQYPNDRSTSRYINGQAMPILQQEAIQAQSAQVDGVSGATDTSAAFQQSLASALSQAKA